MLKPNLTFLGTDGKKCHWLLENVCVCGEGIDPQEHVCTYKPSWRDHEQDLRADLKTPKLSRFPWHCDGTGRHVELLVCNNYLLWTDSVFQRIVFSNLGGSGFLVLGFFFNCLSDYI